MTEPTLADEIALEEAMQAEGTVRYTRRQQRALQRGQASQTAAGQQIVSGGVLRVAAGITEWVQDQWAHYKRAGAGRKSAEYVLLQECDPNVLAVITLRVVLNALHETPKYVGLTSMLGREVEKELRYRAFEKKDRKLFEWAKKQVAKATSARHKSTVMTWSANKAGVEWLKWTDRLHAGVGAVLLQVLMKKVGIVSKQNVTRRSGKKFHTDELVIPNAGTFAWIKAFNTNAMICYPMLLPTIIPPKPWTTPTDGGYHSPKHVGTQKLVKKARKPYLKELELCNPTEVYSAVNHLQETSWQINAEVYQAVSQLWVGHNAFAGLPPAEDIPLPHRPEDIESNEEARKAYRREAAEIWDKRKAHAKERLQGIEVMTIARKLLHHDKIYFPHGLDFRGRVYALPGSLNPQGSPLAKGLLRFAEGKPLSTPEALRWFMIHGANCAGVDKVSFEDRVAWVKEHHQRIIDTAFDPSQDLWWTELDSPFCFLAFCFEYAGYHRDPSEFKSRLPVMLDGSCSGLQHFSAMLRDEDTARRVNLVPCEKPQDVYGEVAADTRGILEGMKANSGLSPVDGYTFAHTAAFWLEIGVDRKLVKRNVMTLPYGSTRHSHADFIFGELSERLAKRGIVITRENIRTYMQLCVWIAGIVWDSIERLVSSARVAMAWLQAVARKVSEAGYTLSWLAPSGFPVLQSYRKMKGQRVELALGDEIKIITLTHETPELDTKRQATAVAPNFVHSMDAAALVGAVNEARGLSIGSVACVHDSFGTHAADTEAFAGAIRDSFAKMYEEHDVLEEFRQAMEGLGIEIPPVPTKGTLEISRVRQSPYCFA